MRIGNHLAISMVVGGGISLGGVAFAQSSPSESAVAEALYREARQLMAEGKLDEACPKFAESQRLDPGTGTLLNLAVCHERQGLIATAWVEYSQALNAARRDHREDRVRYAQTHLAAIEPRLSYIRVVPPSAPGAASIETELDGASIRGPSSGVATPVDPGIHSVTAHAPGFKPWSQRVSIDRDGMNVTVTVPILEPDGSSGAPAATADRPSSVPTAARPIPTSVYISGGVTLAATTGAVVTGIVYLSRYHQYGSAQPDSEVTKTRTWGTLNTVFVGCALVGATVTAYLYFTRPDAPAAPRVESAAIVAPWLTTSGAGFSIQGQL